jgi:hypothetical protein
MTELETFEERLRRTLRVVAESLVETPATCSPRRAARTVAVGAAAVVGVAALALALAYGPRSSGPEANQRPGPSGSVSGPTTSTLLPGGMSATLHARLLPEEAVPDLQSPGTPVPAADITTSVKVRPNLSFGLAVFTSLQSATYPAISTDGGATWSVDGPRFDVAAAQGASQVSDVGALPPNGAYAWGQGGDVVRVTTDQGAHWWGTGFNVVYSVNTYDGSLYVVAGPPLSDGSINGYLYISHDRGMSWTFVDELPEVERSRTGTQVSPSVTFTSDGVGSAKFSESQAGAQAEMDSLFGQPTATIGQTGNCTVDTLIRWGEVSMYFSKGSFVGYRALGSTAQYPSGGGFTPGGKGTDGGTAVGLRVGDSLADAQALYGSALTTTTAQGGAWTAVTPSGIIHGNLSGVPGQRPSSQLLIESIGAGDVGCPAAAP